MSVNLPAVDTLWSHTIFDWLISLSLFQVSAMLLHVSESPSFSRINIVWIYHFLFTHSFVDRYLGCFHLSATVNNTAMNIHIQVSVIVYFQLGGYIPRSRFSASYGTMDKIVSPPKFIC